MIQLFPNMRTMDASSNAGGEFAPLIQKSSSDSHGGNTRAWWLVASGVACLALAGCAVDAAYVYSLDHGATWSAPVPVPFLTGNKWKKGKEDWTNALPGPGT